MAKKKSSNIPKIQIKNKPLIAFLSVLVIVLAVTAIFIFIFINRIFPGIYIAGTDVSTLTSVQAEKKVLTTIKERQKQTVVLEHKNQKFEIDLTDSIKNYNLEKPVTDSFDYGRKKIYFNPIKLDINPDFNKKYDSQIEKIAAVIDSPPINSQLKIQDGEITVTPSQTGVVLDKEKLKEKITAYLNSGQMIDNNIPVKTAYPKLSYQTALSLKQRLDQIKLEPLKLKFKGQTFIWDISTVLDLIDLNNAQSSLVSGEFAGHDIKISSVVLGDKEYVDTNLTLNKQELNKRLKEIAAQIDQPVIEPLFNFDPSSPNKITEFQPPQEGQELNLDEAENRIAQALLTKNQTIVNLPVDITKPKNKLSNEMGINELIGRGISNFSGSIPNRIFNVSHGASKINGVIIPPDAIFSFNQTVGDITAATGFKQAYVIKSGRTVLDDGGGICQVSTTLYRAVLNSGLPVVKRTAHAYRVSYYEQGFPPGLDATIYYPSVDFQFKNDTGKHILIQTYVNGTTLTVDFYGTSDGRVSKVSTPKILSQTPPPPELRQDDPTLPKGTVKQVDWSAWGAKVIFTRTVTRNGETLINETVTSNYRPWQAVYLVGTGG